jgi:hypothetical protein
MELSNSSKRKEKNNNNGNGSRSGPTRVWWEMEAHWLARPRRDEQPYPLPRSRCLPTGRHCAALVLYDAHPIAPLHTLPAPRSPSPSPSPHHLHQVTCSPPLAISLPSQFRRCDFAHSARPCEAGTSSIVIAMFHVWDANCLWKSERVALCSWLGEVCKGSDYMPI